LVIVGHDGGGEIIRTHAWYCRKAMLLLIRHQVIKFNPRVAMNIRSRKVLNVSFILVVVFQEKI